MKTLKKLHRSKLSEKLQASIKARFNDSVSEISEIEGGGIMLRLSKPEQRMGEQATVFPIHVAKRSEGHRAEAAADESDNKVQFSFSSEYPVLNGWGEPEILSHHSEDADFSRFAEVGAVLYNHNPNLITGKPEQVWLDEATRMGMCIEEFGTTDIALQAKHEVLVDKTLRGISCGFLVTAWVWLENDEVSYRGIKGKEGGVWVGASWQALESSHTPIPADPTSKVGRSVGGSNPESREHARSEHSKKLNREVTEMELKQRALALGLDPETATWDQVVKAERKQAADEADKTARKEATDAADQRHADDQARRGEIMAIAKGFSLETDGQRYCDEGKSVADFNSFIVGRVQAGDVSVRNEHSAGESRDLREFKFSKFIRETMSDPTGGALTGLEKEMHEEAGVEARACGGLQGTGIPLTLMRASSLTAGAAAGGAEFVPEQMGSMIDTLENKMLCGAAGANIMTGLSANISMPRIVTSPDAVSLAETAEMSDGTIVTGELQMSPNRIGATLPISKQLIIQNPAAGEPLIRRLLVNSVALRADFLALHGTGASSQPTGLFNTNGIGLVVGGTNGLAPSRAHIVGLETEVSIDNADMGSLAYMTNAAVRGKLKNTLVDAGSGQFVWKEGADQLIGYKAHVTNQILSNLTKGTSSGVCSGIAFGDWSQMDIGFFGGLDIVVDPYAQKKKAMLEITVNAFMDVAIEQPQAFAVMKDALTA